MGRQKIDSKSFIADVESGVSDDFLKDKYELDQAGLEYVFSTLREKGFLHCKNRHGSSITRTEEKEFCPACKGLIEKDAQECLFCGIVLAKYLEIRKRQKECPNCHTYQDKDKELCPVCGFDWNQESRKKIEQDQKRRAEIRKKLQDEQRVLNEKKLNRFIEQCVYEGIPTLLSTPIALKKGEEAYYTSEVRVVQQKSKTRNFRGYAGTRLKIGKLPLYLGGSAPYSTKEEVMEHIGTGHLAITNRRVVLWGAKINYSIQMAQINGVETYADAVQIFNEGPKGGRYYYVKDPQRASIIIQVIINDDGTPGWLKAINDDSEEIIARLIEKGLDVNSQSSDKVTPLIAACRVGNMNLAKTLIAKGANVNAIANGKCTALMLAAEGGHKEIVEQLLEHGARAHLKDNAGLTASDYALNSGYNDIEELLSTDLPPKKT